MLRSSVRVVPVAALAAVLGCPGGEPGIRRVGPAGYFSPVSVGFGEVAIGDVEERMVRLTNAAAEPIQIEGTSFEPSSNAFVVRRANGETARGTSLGLGASVDLVVRFGPDRAGDHDGTLVIRTERLEIPLAITASARAVAPARLEPSPSSIDFLEVAIGATLTLPVVLTNTGERDASIDRAVTIAPFNVLYPDGSGLSGRMLAAGDSMEIRVDFQPAGTGPVNATVLLATDAGVETTIEVRGEGASPGLLTCDAASIDLGPVTRGESARRTVTCATGPGPYRLAAIRSDRSPSEFAIENASATPGSPISDLTFDIVYRASGVAHTRDEAILIESTHGAQTRIELSAATVPPDPGEADISTRLAWDSSSDLDLHFVRAGGLPFLSSDDCYYENPTVDWNVVGDEQDDPFLDGDVRVGPGAETTTMNRAAGGAYDIYVFYNDHLTATPVVTAAGVDVVLGTGASATFDRTLSTCGALWWVGTIRFDQSPPRVDTVDTVSMDYASVADCAD